MLVSRAWLNDWVKFRHTTPELGEFLTLAGLEVSSIHLAGPQLSPKYFVTGKISRIEPHPDADNLHVCSVDIGRTHMRTIVCDACNIALNMKTVVALPGAKVGDKVIKAMAIRGVKSQGMLCSMQALGFESLVLGVMALDADAPVGQPVCDYLQLNDDVLEIELTPNRGDCLSVIGVAREIAIQTGAKLKPFKVVKVPAHSNTVLPIKLQSAVHCPRYMGRAIEGLDISVKTPDWIQERLRRVGMRSINPVVDVSNYVMHQIGQPMHAFDLQKIHRGIVIRQAKKAEKLTLLDGSKVTLSEENLVIADQQQAIALAGIMGGANSAISNNTENIYLEAAFFSPDAILGKARMLAMHTEASHHFERGVDFNLPQQAIELATQMIIDICGGKPGPVTHAVEKKTLPKCMNIRLDRTEIKRTLSISVADAKVKRILTRLGMVVKSDSQGWKVLVPSWRFDIIAQHDLIEEVARCYGYEKIPSKMPTIVVKPNSHQESKLSTETVKDCLINQGYYEAISYSFVGSEFQSRLLKKNNAIRINNPISENMAVMRQSLWPGLIEVALNNFRRQHHNIRVFEIGHVFSSVQQSLEAKEVNKLGGLVTGLVLPRQWSQADREVDFYDLKGDIEGLLDLTRNIHQFEFSPAQHPALQPEQCAEISLCGKKVGIMGKLSAQHQKISKLNQAIFLFEMDMKVMGSMHLPIFKEVSRYPSVQRDLAILVNRQTPIAEIHKKIRRVGGHLLKEVCLFDVYDKNIKSSNRHSKSIAFSLTFQSESSNLTAAVVDVLMKQITQALSVSYAATMRQ